jgi:hypothetical protein
MLYIKLFTECFQCSREVEIKSELLEEILAEEGEPQLSCGCTEGEPTISLIK